MKNNVLFKKIINKYLQKKILERMNNLIIHFHHNINHKTL